MPLCDAPSSTSVRRRLAEHREVPYLRSATSHCPGELAAPHALARDNAFGQPGEAFTAEARATWTKLYGMLSSVMRMGAQNALGDTVATAR